MAMVDIHELIQRHRQKLEWWYDEEMTRLTSQKQECLDDCRLLAKLVCSHAPDVDSRVDTSVLILPSLRPPELIAEAARDSARTGSGSSNYDKNSATDTAGGNSPRTEPAAARDLRPLPQRSFAWESGNVHELVLPGTPAPDSTISVGDEADGSSNLVKARSRGEHEAPSIAGGSGDDAKMQRNISISAHESSESLNTIPLPFSSPLPLLYGTDRVERHSSRQPRGKDSFFKNGPIVTDFSLTSSLTSHKLKWPGLATIVSSDCFRALCGVVILLNAIFMGVAANEMLVSSIEGQTEDPALEIIEICFCIFFFVELLLRLATEHANFFKSKDAWWNAFDTVLVGLSIIDVALSLFQAGRVMNVSFARTLRVFRFVRILRILRVMRFFYSFRLMMYSVIYSMMSLVWVFAMLVFVMYVFAMFFMHGISEHFLAVQEHTDGRPCDTDACQDLKRLCGDATTTLISLFMAICGGMDWSELWVPLRGVSWVYGYLFVLYIFFMVFGVLNVVVATFVDSASVISRRDRELVTHNELEKNRQYYADIRRFFNEADTDNSGTLSWEEFEEYLQDENLQAYFQSFQLDVTQAKTLFRLLDLDESNDVNIDEFIEGCMRMRGQARSIDVHMLLYESEKMMLRQAELMQNIEKQLGEMKGQMSRRNSFGR